MAIYIQMFNLWNEDCTWTAIEHPPYPARYLESSEMREKGKVKKKHKNIQDPALDVSRPPTIVQATSHIILPVAEKQQEGLVEYLRRTASASRGYRHQVRPAGSRWVLGFWRLFEGTRRELNPVPRQQFGVGKSDQRDLPLRQQGSISCLVFIASCRWRGQGLGVVVHFGQRVAARFSRVCVMLTRWDDIR